MSDAWRFSLSFFPRIELIADLVNDDTLDLPPHPLSSSPLTDMTQELWALGFGCLFASFFKAYPPGGSFSRTALQHEVGVKTPLANVVTSLFVTVSPLGRARTSCVSFPLPFRFSFLFFHDNESNRRSVPVLSPTRIICENYYLSSSRDGDIDVLLSCDSHACLVFRCFLSLSPSFPRWSSSQPHPFWNLFLRPSWVRLSAPASCPSSISTTCGGK